MKIGTKYEETRATLRESIREKRILARKREPEKHSCYFCLMPIDGSMWELIEKRESGETKYFIDDACYQCAKTSVYYHNLPFSLN